MEEQLLNWAPVSNGDVEMKEEASMETPLESIQQAVQQDPTDPQPPPQPHTAEIPAIAQAVAAATPPAASASSARPGSMPPQPSARPEKPVAHGGPTRQYLNTNVTPHLLEGMKYLAASEPEKPLLWLADFLRDRSKEVEGT